MSHQHASVNAADKNTVEDGKQVRHVNSDIDYQPAFSRVELTEIRAPFWGIANHVMQEYFEER